MRKIRFYTVEKAISEIRWPQNMFYDIPWHIVCMGGKSLEPMTSKWRMNSGAVPGQESKINMT